MTGLLLDQAYLAHDTGHGHPERPARLEAVERALTESGLVERCGAIEPRPAGTDELALCHSREYIALAEQDVAAGREMLSTGDTNISPASFRIAKLAAGGVLEAVDAVLEGRVANAFCAVRPPGHHARPAQGMGFCLFNNIAIGARHAQKQHGADRVAIVDWDVHHGNGTQDVFYSDGSVFFFSTHQSPWYPGTGDLRETGEGTGRGSTANRPFPAGAGRDEILGAFDEVLRSIRAFAPDLVMISAGFDSRQNDPLGQFRLTDEDFVDLTEKMLELADQTCEGRVVSVLEGGYSLDGLAAAATAHLRALLTD